MKPAFVPPYKRERETKAHFGERTEFLQKLWELLKPGDTITTVLRHRSSSGMSRAIDLYRLGCSKGEPSRSWLSYWVAKALDDKFDERYDAVRVSGAGMDMGFHLVYNLSYTLYPKGFTCTGRECPSNDHSNGQARPHAFPAEYAGRPVDPEGICPIWDRHTERGDICGLTAAQHPTKRKHHRDGGYALKHQWM